MAAAQGKSPRPALGRLAQGRRPLYGLAGTSPCAPAESAGPSAICRHEW